MLDSRIETEMLRHKDVQTKYVFNKSIIICVTVLTIVVLQIGDKP